MKRDLIFIDSFESEFKGNKYKIFNFVDPNTLIVIRGVDLNVELEANEIYECTLVLKGGKIKVDRVN